MKAVIFDLDGTLLNSTRAWEGVGGTFLDRRGIKYPTNLSEIIKPMSLHEAIIYFQQTYDVEGEVDNLVLECNDIIKEGYAYHFTLKPYAKAFISHLKEQGIKMCIATATNKELAKAALKRTGVLDCFEFIITDEDVGIGKQNPDIFLRAADMLGTKIEECVVFEDSLHAIKTAKQVGFEVWAVKDYLNIPLKQEMLETADRYVQCYKELVDKEDLYV